MLLASQPNNIVVGAECNEPEGLVYREIRPMALSMENLKTFWEKAKEFRTIFNEEISNDFKKFCELFITSDDDRLYARGLFWVIDDFVGVFYLTHISELEAQCHYTFFDRRHKGREELTQRMIQFVFQKYGFRRLNVEIPYYASRHTFGFTFALGFKTEGRKRSCRFYKDRWYDSMSLGILRDEALKNGS